MSYHEPHLCNSTYGQWCSPEHSLHVAVIMQNLELEITTAMYTKHDRCHDKLETQNAVSIMTTTVSIMLMLHLGQGNKEQNKMS